MYKVWLDWDFGQDNVVFKTQKSAKKWLQDMLDCNENLKEDYKTVQCLLDSCSASIEKLEIL